MQNGIKLAALAAIAFAVSQASAQTALFDFQDGTDQGFGHKFSDDASETFPNVSVGGSLKMKVARNGDFQEADRSTGNPSDQQFLAMLAASTNEAGYLFSYDYYIDTAEMGAGAGNFMQLGTYVNTGSGYYSQDFPGSGKDLELNGTQLASGQVFSGTISETFTAKGYDLPAGETFFRFGFIINGDGASQAVYFDNVTMTPIPEPAALASAVIVLPALLRRTRRA